MKLRKLVITTFFLIATVLTLQAEEFKDSYLRYLDAKQYDRLYKLLLQWEEATPEDPELYIGYFNYYLNRNHQSGIAISTQNDFEDPDVLEMTDPETGEVVGYMGGSSQFDLEDVKMALVSLNKGLALRPDRLDRHLGKIHILQEISDFKSESKALTECLNISAVISNEWYWSDDEKLEDGKYFLLNNIQDYYKFWFNKADDESYEAIRTGSMLQISLYPDHVYGFNNLAFTYLTRGEYQEGLVYLLQAEQISPDDVIVINNIALTYKYMGIPEKAAEYFRKLLAFPDEVDSEYIESQLADL